MSVSNTGVRTDGPAACTAGPGPIFGGPPAAAIRPVTLSSTGMSAVETPPAGRPGRRNWPPSLIFCNTRSDDPHHPAAAARSDKAPSYPLTSSRLFIMILVFSSSGCDLRLQGDCARSDHLPDPPAPLDMSPSNMTVAWPDRGAEPAYWFRSHGSRRQYSERFDVADPGVTVLVGDTDRRQRQRHWRSRLGVIPEGPACCPSGRARLDTDRHHHRFCRRPVMVSSNTCFVRGDQAGLGRPNGRGRAAGAGAGAPRVALMDVQGFKSPRPLPRPMLGQPPRWRVRSRTWLRERAANSFFFCFFIAVHGT